ncbi:MAG TPA: hypothetical protein VGP41_12390 [Candidatus Lustribacter sp.]|jgi:hypothetical protein|nr:hypothetical protein [Candidatus Lustribacter sp.]
MTAAVSQHIAVVLFGVLVAFGLIGTAGIVRLTQGPRPWALFLLLTMLEGVQVYGLFAPRPDADVRWGSLVAIAVLCFCGYLQALYFVTVRKGVTTFPRAAFYISVAVLLVLVLAARLASPYLP